MVGGSTPLMVENEGILQSVSRKSFCVVVWALPTLRKIVRLKAVGFQEALR